MISPHDLALGVPLDYLGVAAFALTGALAASRRKYSLLSFAFFAVLAGLAGGSLRDVLIGAPQFWLRDAGYVAVCIAAAGAAWAVGVSAWPAKTGLWLDALGLCAVAVAGAAKAAGFDVAPLSAVVIGVSAALAGGIVRDLLSREPLLAFYEQSYVAAAGVGAGGYVLLRILGTPEPWSITMALAGAFAVCAHRLRAGLPLKPPVTNERP